MTVVSLRHFRSRGFTIVELLIVIVVIGILAAITVVAYNGVQNRATNAKAYGEAAQGAKLLKAYYALYDSYPVAQMDRDRVCLGEGFPDVNADGVGDCQDGTGGTACGGSSCIFSENAAFASELKSVGQMTGFTTLKTGQSTGVSSYTGPMFTKPNVGTALPLSSYGVIYYQYGTTCPAGSQTGAVYGRVVWCAIALDG